MEEKWKQMKLKQRIKKKEVRSQGMYYGCESRPRWSRGNVLASRSKVRGFKPG